jgi:hypothetical protein
MKSIKTALASFAAAGLLIAQPALAAAEVRTGSTVSKSENLAGGGIPSAAWPAIIAILLVAVVSIVSAEGDDDDFEFVPRPVSP